MILWLSPQDKVGLLHVTWHSSFYYKVAWAHPCYQEMRSLWNNEVCLIQTKHEPKQLKFVCCVQSRRLDRNNGSPLHGRLNFIREVCSCIGSLRHCFVSSVVCWGSLFLYWWCFLPSHWLQDADHPPARSISKTPLFHY